MEHTSDSTSSSVSLDDVFTPPSREQWMERAVSGITVNDAHPDPLSALRRTTLEGIPLEVLYDAADAATPINLPEGQSGTWDNRLSVKVDDASKTQAAVLQALQAGITSVELHTTTPADIAISLHDLKLDLAPVSLRCANEYQPCYRAFIELANTQGVEISTLRGALNADPIGTWLTKGDTGQSIGSEITRMATFAKNTSPSVPLATSILVDAAIHHNAGASTVEELHAAIATATLYLEALLDTGMDMDEASKQIVFQVAMDADVLLGVAKLRALQALWQHVISQIDNASAGTTRHATPAPIVAETSRRFMSLMEPWNNHLRNLAASTAAALGGANTLLVHPHDTLQRTRADFDTALGDRMARNIAIILERECGLRKVNDPMAGSYAIENLTQQLMEHTWLSLGTTDTGAGWLAELQSGRWQTRLTHTHRQRVTLMEQEQRIAIGVNRFIHKDENTNAPSSASDTSSSEAHAPEPALKLVREAELFEQRAQQESSS